LERKVALAPQRPAPDAILLAALCVAAIGPFLIGLKVPFVFDDYIHLARPSPAAPLQAIFHTAFLEHPNGGDGFFRPLGVLYYWSVSQWAGTSPAAWHFCGLCIHLANTLLAYLLLRRISGSALAGFGGALLFAWHASHVEAVCWTAASFDLLAAFFCLLVLLDHCIEKKHPSHRRHSHEFGTGLSQQGIGVLSAAACGRGGAIS
jgi:hypothetical protein